MVHIIKSENRGARGMKAMKRTMRQKNQIALRNAKAFLAMEGLFLTPPISRSVPEAEPGNA
jgi:hypothetical protein